MTTKSTKAVILCNGLPPLKAQLLKSVNQADFFIAADGGGNIARGFGIMPDLVIGDLDSYQMHDSDPFPVIKNPDQNTNDLEKALQHALTEGLKNIIVFGATGKRVDQTVKNLSVMKQFDDRFESLIFRDRYSDIQLIHSPFRRQFPLHTSISLFPLSGKVTGITSKGLKYPLTGDTLENGVMDGSSNQTISEDVEITYDRGDLLIFINDKPEVL